MTKRSPQPEFPRAAAPSPPGSDPARIGLGSEQLRGPVSAASAAETAAYIGTVAAQLARLARGSRLDVLAYFLDMAGFEAAFQGESSEADAP